MSIPRIVALATTAALVSACGEAPTQLAEPGPAFGTVAGNPVVGSATGSGHNPCGPDPANPFVCGTDEDSPLRTFSFNARLHADGSVSGRAQFINRFNEIGRAHV